MTETLHCTDGNADRAGWMLDLDPDSWYEGLWVHVTCRKPSRATLYGFLAEVDE